ncbi:hypothetical protein L3Y34_014758 [Caenorhabditis briggsae]|uniref:Homeobox domain-containing protein n=1 Tax=Caenorhabditis briggsae TaxID=6238 RepID=A0AAE9DT75_CAEBR|nr:hypothetical protein L3Y34_014758 [Caenorhabditis briggsae]
MEQQAEPSDFSTPQSSSSSFAKSSSMDPCSYSLSETSQKVQETTVLDSKSPQISLALDSPTVDINVLNPPDAPIMDASKSGDAIPADPQQYPLPQHPPENHQHPPGHPEYYPAFQPYYPMGFHAPETFWLAPPPGAPYYFGLPQMYPHNPYASLLANNSNEKKEPPRVAPKNEEAHSSPVSDLTPNESRDIKAFKKPFTDKQRNVMLERFRQSDRIGLEERKTLAGRIGLSAEQVRTWFANQKAREKAAKKHPQKLTLLKVNPEEKMEHRGLVGFNY